MMTRALLHYGEESISVGFEEISAKEWMAIYEPDIRAKPEEIYKKPGYDSI